jgi:hypothetical protein
MCECVKFCWCGGDEIYNLAAAFFSIFRQVKNVVEFSIKFNFENSSIKFAMLIDRRQTQ